MFFIDKELDNHIHMSITNSRTPQNEKLSMKKALYEILKT